MATGTEDISNRKAQFCKMLLHYIS